MATIDLYVQLSQLFSIMNIAPLESDKFITQLFEISFERMILKSAQVFTPDEQKDINNISKSKTKPQDFFPEFMKNEKYQKVFAGELQLTLNEMLEVIDNNSTPNEKDILQKKLQEITSET